MRPKAHCCIAALLLATLSTQAADCRFEILDAGEARIGPARVHLQDAAGKPVKAPGLPFWHDHFVCTGRVELTLAPGGYRCAVERGPEFSAVRTNFTVGAGATNYNFTLSRLADLAREGWWSGETHVHRAIPDAALHLRAEDLHVAQFITWWNKTNPWTNAALPRPVPVAFDRDRFHHPLAGEDERDGGALLYHDSSEPLAITGGTRHFPSSLVYAQQARARGATWLEAEKPFWWDFPMWVAHGVADTVGIAHNHMHRDGVLDNEAWGRPRDRAAYPGPQGNARWTQDIYYHALNCGLRLPPTAGSASGVLPNPVGYNRAYVQVDGPLTYEKWREGLKAGRSFVSNGPLLRCRANGQWPGHVFRTNGPLPVSLEAKLDSRDPIAAVELVREGRVERIQLPARFTMEESGWFLVRAIAGVTNTFRFASTAPFYVEIGGQPMTARRDSVQFFLDWCQERMTKLAALTEVNAAQREQLLQPWRVAERFWKQKAPPPRTTVTGRVIDAATRQPLAARLYLRRGDGTWLFPTSAVAAGSAVRYEKQNWNNRRAIERHTTLSAHPWRIELEPGRYTATVERGKEYHPLVREFTVGTDPIEIDLPLARWVNMAARGWFSGDTHVHRTLAELPNVMLAEDLNVAFPLNYWVTKAFAPPAQGDKSAHGDIPAGLVRVDDTHVFWPRNTEWEIFTVDGRSHTLGAVFALGHSAPFSLGAPPVGPIAEAARRQGALLDLDKHDWPWSLALVPLMNVDLYELANNHVWRTEFGFTNWNAAAPAYMGLPNQGRSGGALDWLEYSHRTYWTLLNCGFRMRPTAGTASGVHPVPLGFGRVYVHCPGGFSYESWKAGLNAGRSFVTTGPMLTATFNGEDFGHRFQAQPGQTFRLQVRGSAVASSRLLSIEVIVNGKVERTLTPDNRPAEGGAFISAVDHDQEYRESGWLALRCWETQADGTRRFAHSAPVFVDVPGRPLRPRRAEAAFLVQRVRDQISRSRDVLPAAALEEYRKALAIYEAILRDAMPNRDEGAPAPPP